MRQKLKRIICTLLVSVMVLGMMPSYAFAEENTDTAETTESDTGQDETVTEVSDQPEGTEIGSEEFSDQTDAADETELTETESEETDSEEFPEQTKSDTQKTEQQSVTRSASAFGKNAAPQAAVESDNVYLGSTDLNQFTTNAVILKDGEETNELNDGDTYTVRLGFGEESGTEGQINFNELMTYTLPDGLTLVDTGEDISIRASVRADDGQMQTVTVSFTIGRDSDGNVTLEPRDNQEAELQLLARADNASFEMYVDVRYNGEAGDDQLDFGNDVIKDITVTSESDLTINKTASYNKANGTVDYTLTITSSGTNTNVHLSDTIGGDAVTLDPDTIRVSSNMGTTDAQVTASGNTLTSNNFNMTGGEVITVTYSAAVDYTKLDGNIIDWDNTANALSVESDQNQPEDVSAGINHQTAFDYASKSNVGGFDSAEVSEDGKSYILSWQIVVNPDFMDTGDITITDTLGNKDLQSYDPNSFQVSAVTKDGTTVEGVTILPPSTNDVNWMQTLPSVIDGQPVRYTITYNTLVDKATIDDSWTQTTVSNDLDVPGTEGDSTTSVGIPTQNDYQVTKEYTDADMDAQTVDWLVTVTAPEEGFDTFTVTDTLPGTWSNNTWYGNVVDEDSLIVSVNGEELESGTDYAVDWDQNYTEGNHPANFMITFMTGAHDQGLAAAAEGTGDQTVTIAFTSNYGGTGWPEGQMMTNTASVTANEVTHGATASYTPADKTIEKTVDNNGSFDDSDINKEVTYYVAITGVTESDLDEHGRITVTDTYNSKYLRIVENPYWLEGTNVTGTNEQGNYNGATGADYRYTISYGEPSADGMREVSFTFTPIRDSGGNLYSRYYFRYQMAIADADAMRELVEAAASDPTGSLDEYLSNTAAWGDLTDEYTVGFESSPLSKSVFDKPTANNNQTITWQLTINQNKARLNNGEPMELVDDFTVQDPSEYEMTYVDGSMSISYDGVSQNDVDYTYTESENGGGTLTWSIPDETAVVIKYQTQIVGDTTGKTQFRNRAKLNGEEFTDNAGQDYPIESGGSGTASTLNFDILKQDINDLTVNLPGAMFELYADDGSGNPTPMIVDGKEVVPSYTSGEDGVIRVISNQTANGWALRNHRIYYLKEVKAPEGYDIPEDGIWIKIWITEFGDDNIDEAEGEVARPDDAIVVNNNTTIRVTNGQVTIPVSKQLLGGEWKDGEQYQVEITADPASEKPAPMPSASTLTFTADSTDYFVLSGFTEAGTYRYLIREVVPEEKEDDITYSGAVYNLVVTAEQMQETEDSPAHLEVGYTLTKIRDDQGNEINVPVSSADFINSKGTGNLSLIKVVEGTTTESTFDVQVKLDNTSVNGKYGDLTFKNGIADVQLTAGQTKTATGLPAGVTYTVTEVNVPDGYQVSYSGETGTITAGGTAQATVTNTYHRTVDVSVEKKWLDYDNQDGKRPESIRVQLYADNNPVGEAVTLNTDNDWSYTWRGLDEEINSTSITYSVKEVGEANGTIQFNGATYRVMYGKNESEENKLTITNTHIPETVSATVRKVWNDADNQDGKRPLSIRVALMNGNTLIDTVTLNSDNDWKATVENLPKYTNGIENVYSWTEDMTGMPEGYTLTGSSTEGTVTTLTNSYTPETIQIPVTKNWRDNNDQDGIRPKVVTVKLLADGKDTGKTLALTEADNWSGSFTDLAKYKGGVEIGYTVEEVVVDGYEAVIEGNMTAGYVITNSHIPETTEVSGSKTWDDANNQDGKRPASITIHLLANGKELEDKELTVTADDGWKWEFKDLPKYENGKEITYTITEDAVPDYTIEINGYDVTNSYTPGKTSVTVTKSWNDADNQDGKRPDSIQVQLYADGKAQGEPVVLNDKNHWSHTWSELDEKSAGNTIEYTVKEVGEIDGKIVFNGAEYQVTCTGDATTGYTLTNSYTPETTEVSGSKTWDDANNQDGKRPASITIHLLANGKELEDKELTVTADDGWKWEFKDLPKYENGKEITYTITEDAVPDYTIEINGYDVTNSYTPGKTSVTVTKSWNDADNQDGKRPDSIQVQLYADGKAQGEPVVLNDKNHWSHTWSDLDEKADSKTIEYTVKEVGETDGKIDFDGAEYEVTCTGDATTGYTITNSYTPETTEVSGSKTWDDANNQDGKRPTSITINLLANGEKVDEKTVSADDNWSWSFTNLPKYENGKEITYTITEDAVPDYTIEIDGYDVTNSYTPGKTSVSVTKTWDDAGDQDGKRPESIQVQLYADGKEQGEPVVLNVENHWSHTWSDLDEKADSKTIEYTVKEVGETDGKIDFDGAEYEVTCTGDATTGYTITNSYTPETTEVSGSKTWDDANNQDGKRPASITINLLANGTEVAEKTVSADDNWSWSFTNLPKYENGAEIVYTITEDAVPDYTAEIDGYDVTNTYKPGKTSVSVTKNWDDADDQDGKRPESIQVQLYADGKEQGEPVVLNDGNHWSHTWSELDEKSAGNTIEYTVKEVGETGGKIDFNGAEYEVTCTGDAASGYTITNSYTLEKTSVPVTKSWQDNNDQDGIRPNAITVKLLADEKDTGKTLTLNEANNWSSSFTDLAKYKDGEEISYTVEEVSAEGYETVIEGNVTEGYIITNSHTPETTEVSGSKTWDDANDQDGKRPTSITINLLANGVQKESQTVTEEDNWSWSFTNLPKYENGTEIIYTITEDAVPDYTTVVNGYDVTNSYTPGKTSVTVTKSWQDNNDQDGIRPNEITVKLLANGKDTGKTLTLNEANNWSGSFTELAEYENGKVIEYTVEEVSTEGYDTVIEGNVAEGYIITNSHTPETTEVSGSKTWDDANDQDGKRPASITINLLANGVQKESKTVTEEDNWSWSFTNLPKYENGVEITYTITEDAVPDYATEINGYDVTNSYTPGKTSVSVAKNWNDADNQDGKRPENIQVQLYADGKAQGEPVVLNAENNWSHIWSELDEKSAGNTIKYTVKEVGETDGKIDFDGAEYQVAYAGDAVTGYTIINSYITEKVEVSGSKTWDDKGNEGARPDSITIRLYADNKEIDRAAVTAENDWSWSFENLPKYRDGGQEIIYTITEDAVKNYITEVDGYDVTNKYQPGKTGISVAKRWDDSDNRDGKRPDSVRVQLYADGEAVGDPVTLNKSNDWRYTWSELDKQADGKEILYTVKEVGEEKGTIDFDGTEYKVTYTGNAEKGYTITNSYNAVSVGVQTGDNTNMASNLAVMFAAMAAAGAVMIFRRRRYKE